MGFYVQICNRLVLICNCLVLDLGLLIVLLTFLVRVRRWHVWHVGLMLCTAVRFNSVVHAEIVVIGA
jgi:hypothetical protein